MISRKDTTLEWIAGHAGVKRLCRIAGISAFALIVYSVVTMVLLIAIGTQPLTVEECFQMLQENKLVGLLRLDILTVLFIPLYYVLFVGLYFSLKESNQGITTLSVVLVFIGITLFLATPSVFSWLFLSNRYAGAVTPEEQRRLIAAGEVLFASDMWHGTGAIVGSLLTQLGGIFISWVMLRSAVFSKLTAYTGLVTHGFDFLHIFTAFIYPAAGTFLMAVAGPLYLLWFFLVGRKLWQIGKGQARSLR
jgi:hypothetical protein